MIVDRDVFPLAQYSTLRQSFWPFTCFTFLEYLYLCRALQGLGATIDGPLKREYNELSVELWPRVSWSPLFALTISDLKARLSLSLIKLIPAVEPCLRACLGWGSQTLRETPCDTKTVYLVKHMLVQEILSTRLLSEETSLATKVSRLKRLYCSQRVIKHQKSETSVRSPSRRYRPTQLIATAAVNYFCCSKCLTAPSFRYIFLYEEWACLANH